jgi:hypothetical protein
MPQTARYYLSRVIKLGELDDAKIINAIREPVSISRFNFDYTFIDVEVVGKRPTYVFGRLAKYQPKAEVEVVETRKHEQAHRNVANLLVAASPFVFIPDLSALAYQHIWHQLEREQFEQYFADLIIEKHGGFFVDCAIRPISDLRSFVVKLSRLDTIQRINATVFPPNPLFGPLWKSLGEYVRTRNLAEVAVREQAQDPKGIDTRISEVAETLLSVEDASGKSAESAIRKASSLLSETTTGIGDAAILMAADGYGKATIEGTQNKKRVTVRTRDTHRSFRFDREPSHEELFTIARAELERVNLERGLEHQ